MPRDANRETLRVFCENLLDQADLSLLDPNVTFEDPVYLDHRGTYRGHEGVRTATRTWLEAYRERTLELEDVVGSGDRLVTIHVFRAKGRTSGIDQAIRYAYLWTFRNGKVVHFATFGDPAEAIRELSRPG